MESKGFQEIIISAPLQYPETYSLINKSDPSKSISIVVDQMEVDVLTIRDVEERISKKLPSKDLIEITETFYSNNLDPREALSYFQDIQPLYFKIKDSILVEPDSFFKVESFRIPIATHLSGSELFDEISKSSGIPLDCFFVLLNNGKTTKRLSRRAEKIDLELQKETKLILKPVAQGDIPITISIQGESKDVRVALSSTVEQLKELIDIYLEVPGDALRLVFDSEALIDEQKLSFYKIQAGSKITCFRTNRASPESMGTFMFVDVSNDSIAERREFVKEAPEWRIVRRPGLCLEGKCTNKDCKANGKYVIINKGFGLFDVGKNRYDDDVICPMCKKIVDFETCAFSNCLYSYVGKKFVDRKLTLVRNIEPKRVGDYYLRFDPSDDNKVVWECLKITTMDPKSESVSPTEMCQVCKKKVGEDCVLLSCKVHKIDKTCVTSSGINKCHACK